MKSKTHILLNGILVAIVMFSTLCGCGSKGALYLPNKNSESGVAQNTAPMAAPAPSEPPNDNQNTNNNNGVNSISGGASGRQF